MDLIVNARERRPRWVVLAVAAALTLGAFASGAHLMTGEAARASVVEADGDTAPGIGSTPAATESAAPAVPTAAPTDPVQNIVFVLADDLDTATFEQVARLKALHAQGMTLNNMVVTESLCCPSRTSILRSQYVHNHGVVSNLAVSNGGWATFAAKGEEEDCLPVWLHAAGVETAYVGKYLNGYGEDGDPTAIPAGWDRWFAPTTKSGMYRGFGYTVNSDRRLVSYANGRKDFLPDVITEQAVDYLRTARAPFYLQINSTSPHEPAPVATRHRAGNTSDRIPRGPAFNKRGSDPPKWRSKRKHINTVRMDRYDEYWRKRVRSSESIADTIDAVVATLRETGALESTMIVISSDNGFHAGQRRLPPGKRTPYLEDTVVPAIVIGPGITPGSHANAMTSTIDLGPTFAELLGATVPEWVDGRSLVPLLIGGSDIPWRTGVLSESLGVTAFNDPDFEAFTPPNYYALRTPRWLYVEYANGSRELFDRRRDPAEADNVLAKAAPEVVADLRERLHALMVCAGEACRAADTWTGTPSAAG